MYLKTKHPLKTEEAVSSDLESKEAVSDNSISENDCVSGNTLSENKANTEKEPGKVSENATPIVSLTDIIMDELSEETASGNLIADSQTISENEVYEKLSDNLTDMTSVLSSIVQAQGTYGNLIWEVNGTTLTISGTGDMGEQLNASKYPWYSYLSNIKNIVINSGATSISNYAFDGFYSVDSITLPEGLQSIGNNAFYKCLIESIRLPSSLRTIGKDAFYSDMLASVVVANGNNYFSVKDNILYDKNITTLLLYPPMKNAVVFFVPEGVIKIARHAIRNNISLKQIIIPASVSIIDDEGISFCSYLQSISVEKTNIIHFRFRQGISSNSYMPLVIIAGVVIVIDIIVSFFFYIK